MAPECASGRDGFDPAQNAQVCDVAMKTWRGTPCLGLRLKVIKQDPRMERPEAAGNEDWQINWNCNESSNS